MSRPAYPSEVTDQEWDFVVPSLTLMKEDAPPREYPLRELFSARRGFVRAGGPWRMRPNDLPPWTAVEQQAKGWMRAGCFEAMAHDLRIWSFACSKNERNSPPPWCSLGAPCQAQPGERGTRG